MRKIFTISALFFAVNLCSAQDAALSPPSGSFLAPVSGCPLSPTENVVVRLFNYGPGTINTPFSLSYTINAGPPVTEVVGAPNIPVNTAFTYTFTTTANLSGPGTYTFTATVALPGDPNPANDTYSGYVVNSYASSFGGIVTGPSSVCASGNAGVVTISGNNCPVTQWEYSTDGGSTWLTIANVGNTQSFNNLTSPTLYRAQVQNGSCPSANSAPISIAIDQPSVGGSVTADATVCNGVNAGTLNLSGQTGSVIRWESSTDGGVTWSPIANTTNSLSYNNIVTTTEYRAVVQNGSCGPANSSPATITVSPTSNGGSIIPANTNVCSGQNAGTLTLSGQVGNVLDWEFSTDGGVTWTVMANTTTSQTYSNLVTTTNYRALVQSGNCAPVYSIYANVIVGPGTVPGTLASSTNVCSGANAGTLNLTGNSRSIVQWEFSTDGGVTWNIIANLLNSQTYNNITMNTEYRVLVQNGGCPSAYSNIVTLTVDQPSVGGTVSSSTNVCSGINNGFVTLSGQTGSVLNWEYSTDGGITWNNIANTSTTQTYTNLTVTTEYRAVVANGSCTSAFSTPAIITVDPTSVGGTITGGGTVCSGSSGVLTLTGNTGTPNHWEYSTDGGLTWINIVNTTTTQNYTNITTNTVYKAFVKSGSCTGAFSSSATVNVNTPSVGGSVSSNATVCSGANAGTLTLSGQTGTILNWQFSTDGGITWFAIANTTTTQNYLNLVQTTEYRAVVQSGVCPSAFSTPATITVNPVSVGGNVTANATVCAGANAGTLNLAGQTGAIIDWEYSTDGGTTWITIANTTTSLNYSNLMVTTMYHARIQSGACGPVTSSAATITVNPVSNGGTISSAATVCSGANGATLTLSGQTGNVLNWQSSTDGGITWTPIANTTTTQTYLNLTQTTLYQAVVQSGVCPSANSATVNIVVNPATVGGAVTSNATVCAGANAGTLTLAGQTGNILDWESSTDGGTTWLTIANTSTTQNYMNLMTTTLYHARVQSGVCPVMVSANDTITVNPVSHAGTLSSSATICSGMNNGLMTLSGYTGAILGWQNSTDGGVTWTGIVQTTDTMSYTNLTMSTEYRVIVQSGVCNPDTSMPVTITVNPMTVAGILATGDTVCSGMNNGTLMLTGNVGTIQGWQLSTDGGLTWMSNTDMTDSLQYRNLTQTTWYKVTVQSGVCPAMASDTVQILVNPRSVAGTIQGSMAGCRGISGTLTLTGTTGAIVKWQHSIDGGVTWVDSLTTSTTYAYVNDTVTTWYRVIVLSGVCNPDTAMPAVITVYPKPMAAYTVAPVCQGNASMFVNTSTISSGSIVLNNWNFGDSQVSTAMSPSHVYATAGTYTTTLVTLSDHNCSDTATVNVTVNAVPSAMITASGPLSICFKDSVKLSVDTASNLVYTWNSGPSTSAITVDTAGKFIVTVRDTVTGCSSRDSATVIILPLPHVSAGNDTTINLGSTITLNGSGAVSYLWTPIAGLNNGNIPNPEASPDVNTTYVLLGSDANGCRNRDTVVVKVVENFNFIITNLITPNGDGYNDTWYVQNITLYPNNKVLIFNREGQEVFSASSYDNTWGGTYQGKVLPDGTYYYVLKFTDTGKVFKGAITILSSK